MACSVRWVAAAAAVAVVASCGGGSSPPPPPACTVAADCGTAAHGSYACTAGACLLASCDAGWADCDGLVASGCEADLQTSVEHCGTCATSCGAVANGLPACVAGSCRAGTCDAGFADCDGTAANGCEASPASDPANCGGCGNVCPTPPNATAACASSTCGIGACSTGWFDCDGVAANGCETSLASDPANCGACGNVCPAGNACISSTCTAAACVPGSPCSSDGGQACDGTGACVPTSVVVVQVGDGSATLTNAATPAFLRRFGLDGAEIGSPIALPVSASGSNHPLTLSGTATSEGALSRSADFRYLVLAGYGATPGTSAIASTPSQSVNRVIGRVDASGGVDTSTSLPAAFDMTNVRSATSADGSAFWAGGAGSGASSGIQYAVLGTAASTQILAAPANTRTCQVFAGQLYCDSGSSPFLGVFAVGAGLPTTPDQTATVLPGLPTTTGASPSAFVFLDRTAVGGLDTLYVADDRGIATGGGVQKWTFDGASWSLAGTFTGGLTAGARGLTGFVANGHVTLVATDSVGNANHLAMAVDDGVNAPTFTVLVTAPANTVFRGVAPMPSP